MLVKRCIRNAFIILLLIKSKDHKYAKYGLGQNKFVMVCNFRTRARYKVIGVQFIYFVTRYFTVSISSIVKIRLCKLGVVVSRSSIAKHECASLYLGVCKGCVRGVYYMKHILVSFPDLRLAFQAILRILWVSIPWYACMPFRTRN